MIGRPIILLVILDSSQTYDRIGASYRQTRREDPRLAQRIVEALGNAGSVLNVGAGTGSYEPRDRAVVAVEPALTMIRQRPSGAAPTVRAMAEALPFRDSAFGAGLAVLTIHHWQDWEKGLKELTRVASERVVLLTWDPESEGFWLVQDYSRNSLRPTEGACRRWLRCDHFSVSLK